MWLKKVVCIVLSCFFAVGTITLPANAEEETAVLSETEFDLAIPLATNSFSMTVAAESLVAANSSFSLMVGETVTIKASYAPFTASVDFGLLDSDGVFHYFNVTNGSIDKTIEISTSGQYTLVVRNNSTDEVKVSGFVNY